MLEGVKGGWLIQEKQAGSPCGASRGAKGLAAEEGSCRHICTLGATGLAAKLRRGVGSQGTE